MRRRRMKVDMDALVKAMLAGEEANVERLLDLHAGTVRARVVTSWDDDSDPEDDDPDRFAWIPPVGEPELYREMRRFAARVTERQLAETLDLALRGRRAFRRFHEAVKRHGLTDAWLAARDAAITQEAVSWLQSLGIEPLYACPPWTRAGVDEAPVPFGLVDLLVARTPERGPDGSATWVAEASTDEEAQRLYQQLARSLRALEEVDRVSHKLELQDRHVRLVIEIDPGVSRRLDATTPSPPTNR